VPPISFNKTQSGTDEVFDGNWSRRVNSQCNQFYGAGL
jgi:hypothetical protein